MDSAVQGGLGNRGERDLPQATAAHVSARRDYIQVARWRKWLTLQAGVIVPLAALAALAFSLHQAQYQGSIDAADPHMTPEG